MTNAQLDKALVDRVLRGDAAAFRRLFDASFPRLYRFALARLNGNHDAATEVVQAAFCKAIERLDTYRGEASLYSWLYRICSNALVDYCRRNRRSAELLLEDGEQARAILESLAAPASDEPEAIAGRQELKRVIQSVLDYMPDRQAGVLEMKYLESLSVGEIGTRLGIGNKAAESLLTRARQSFRQAVSDLVELSGDGELQTYLRDSSRG